MAEQLKQPEIEITSQILKQAKRFHATMGLDTASQILQKEIKRVQNYNELMREFPMNELLGATEVAVMIQAVRAVVHENLSPTDAYDLYLALKESDKQSVEN